MAQLGLLFACSCLTLLLLMPLSPTSSPFLCFLHSSSMHHGSTHQQVDLGAGSLLSLRLIPVINSWKGVVPAGCSTCQGWLLLRKGSCPHLLPTPASSPRPHPHLQPMHSPTRFPFQWPGMLEVGPPFLPESWKKTGVQESGAETEGGNRAERRLRFQTQSYF